MNMHVISLLVVFAIVAGGSSAGCANRGSESSATRAYSPQEALGVGIVKGTIGAQMIEGASKSGAVSVKGQVVRIEGGAYVVSDISGHEHRLPIDQNTSIDRPAHVGDWVNAYLDSGGLATSIRNIDEEMAVGQPQGRPAMAAQPQP